MESDTSDEYERAIAAGDQLVEAERWQEALAQFSRAWGLVPEPKDEQAESVAVLAAIADCSFALGRWSDCCNAVQQAFNCGASLDDVFLRIRMGEATYELGDRAEAANWLAPVYLMEGREPLEGEDPKYLESFRGSLTPPEGGWPQGW